MVRVNFQCRGVRIIWIIVWQGPTALAVRVGGEVIWIFFLSSISSLFYLPLWGKYQNMNFTEGSIHFINVKCYDHSCKILCVSVTDYCLLRRPKM